MTGSRKKCVFVGSSKKDLVRFPDEVKQSVGYAIYVAQSGKRATNVKPLKGLGTGILEVVEDHQGDTYRAVYIAKLGDTVYVLHAFKKKSKTGIATPKKEIDIIKARLKFVMERQK